MNETIKIVTVVAALSLSLMVDLNSTAYAQSMVLNRLSGQVSSLDEPVMEGVVITAKKDGSTISVSVISDQKGRFSFPAERLEPGTYTLKARAAGYTLEAVQTVTIIDRMDTQIDLQLKKLKSLAGSLTNAEWLMSIPGTDNQKKFLLNCTSCHTLERIMKSSYDSEGFNQVLSRMSGYYPGSTPLKPQRLAGDFQRLRERGSDTDKITDWLASVNLSSQTTWNYELKTMPRPKGRSTKVVYTEYDLPNQYIQPHDVVLDREGNAWYSDFGQMFLGKMDTKSGKVTQYPIPVVKDGWPLGSLDLELDADDNPWLGVMYQSAIAKFDRETETFKIWSTPKEWDTAGGQLGHLAVAGTKVDNKVWIKNSDGTNIYRLDLNTDKFENLGAPKDPQTGKKIGTYGLHSDAENNVYLLDFSAGNIVKIDAKTKAQSFFVTPLSNSTTPRRGRVSADGKLWFAEYRGMAIGMFDPKTEKIQEWVVPSPWSAPYDAVASRNGKAWTGSMSTDLVSRLDVKTGVYTEYMLPRPTNIRRVFVDDRRDPEVLWIGSNHGASIVKVEPLD